MLHILIADDEQEKVRLITQTFLEIDGLGLDNIHTATNVVAAKRAISKTRYDLILVDINMPPQADKRAEVGAGLDILRFIKNNDKANAPGYLIGMTAYDASFKVAADEFSSPLWKLIPFSFGDPSWQHSLQEATRFILSSQRPPYVTDGRTYHLDLAIFVALEDEELESVLALPGNWIEEKLPFETTRYFRGQFVSESGNVSVVVAAAPRMGMPAAGVIATKLIEYFRPRYLAICGICAGVKKKTKIGDIIIADPCFDWGSGKWIRDKATQDLKFKPALYPWRLDETLRARMKNLDDATGVLNAIHNSFGGKKPRDSPKVLTEAMASGASVLQSQALVDEVKDLHKNLVGIEMESYAVFTAAEYASLPRPKCFSIKAVCDFANEHKSDGYHKYAAHASASFLYRFVVSELGAILISERD